ncbi:MAG: PIN domain-containing protein [Saprospiraceae bacterium]
MDKVFVDTDVIMDLLTARKPFYDHAARLFSLADRAKVRIFVSSLSFANLYYILSKQYSANQARKKLFHFKTLVTVLAVTDKIVELAMTSDFKDFEDGLQYFTATENSIQIFLTRNLRDFKAAEISVLTPEQYLIM